MPVVALTPRGTLPSRVQETLGEDGAPRDSAHDGRAAGFLDELERSTRAPERERSRDRVPDRDTCEAAQPVTTES